MYDQDPLTSSSLLDPVEVVQRVLGPDAETWITGLSREERALAADALKRALVAHELAGNYTTPALLTAFEQLGGSELELDDAVLGEAAVRRTTDPLTQAGWAVVWSRLLRVQDTLTEAEIRSWLTEDVIRGLAARSMTWTRFATVQLADWAQARRPAPTHNALAQLVVSRHPREAARVLADALRADPQAAERLDSRLDERSTQALAAAAIDDRSLPVGVRIMLAGRGDEAVKARARELVISELAVTDAALAALAPDEPVQERIVRTSEDEPSPATRRLAWSVAAVAFFVGSVLGFGLGPAFLLSAAMLVVAWFVGRSPSED